MKSMMATLHIFLDIVSHLFLFCLGFSVIFWYFSGTTCLIFSVCKTPFWSPMVSMSLVVVWWEICIGADKDSIILKAICRMICKIVSIVFSVLLFNEGNQCQCNRLPIYLVCLYFQNGHPALLEKKCCVGLEKAAMFYVMPNWLYARARFLKKYVPTYT